ncbi:hypothetical protein M8C21_024079 [Ambrosia artemisiifolia]|uniref:Zinc finger BED domain-containing protein RICESLEEPER 2-like n=1 Tax=Ambrosia artemisiifolia TaxID=4212 RepID=A0AAD5CI22_AMBAR|nr:hypothetical protein M8C21_024079 [Ambrosia artemisiifolia]
MLTEEERDTIDENLDNDGNGINRKTNSGVWARFINVELKEQGKMVKKAEGIRRYKQFSSGSNNASEFNSSGGFEQMKCREIIAKMILAHELPFSFVEYHWFNEFMTYNNPAYQKVSRETIIEDCIRVVEAEREKMKKVLQNVDMISLTSDCWSSNQTVRYMCLTAHFIDSDWKMQKRVIGFVELAPPYSGEVISDGILECLSKWGIQDKIGTINLNNASDDERAIAILKNSFEGKRKLHFEGMFFHVRCCARILNLVAQDGLRTIDCCLVKIREGVKYLRKQSDRLLKFGEMARILGIETSQSLFIDVQTRWKTTHRMLESAIHYKLAFKGYALRDPNFEWSLTDDEWACAEKVCKVLKVFLDATRLFSATSYPTTNLFLTEIFKAKKVITSAYISDDIFLKKMSAPMYDKFVKYWGETEVLMSIASILDPRFKKVSIHWTFGRLYPDNELSDRVEYVINKLKSLYEKYSNAFQVTRAANSNSTSTSTEAPSVSARQEDDFHAFLKSRPVKNTQKTELEVYLEEPNYTYFRNMEFDVLKWWSQSSSKYPVLSTMARDIFCIPLTTVDSESSFSGGGHMLDDYRSSLSKDMVELFVCGGDWIRSASNTTIQTLEQSTKEEENLEIQIPTSDAAFHRHERPTLMHIF